MLRSCRPALLLLALLATASCSKKTAEEQAAETAAAAQTQTDGDEIDPYQNVVFTFDEAVVGEDQLGRWDTARVVRFTPAVPGKFKWTGDRELTFSPLSPFRPSTVFNAELQPEKLPSDKQKLTLKKPKFHTPFLRMAAPQVFYSRSKRAAGTAELQANLVFNYPVRPSDLRPKLKITQNGQPVAFELSAAEPDKLLAVSFTQDVRPGAPLEIEIAPGLNAVAGDRPTTAPLLAVAEVPNAQTLEIRELTASLLNGEAVVTVLTTQPVSAGEVQAQLKVAPAVNFAVEAQESGFSLKGGFEVGKTYQLTLPAGLRGALGGTLESAFSQAVSVGDARPGLSFASGEKALYLDALGSRNLGLRLNQVQRVKVTIAKIYANNLGQLLKGEPEYGYDGDGDDEGGGQSEDGEYVDRSYRYYDVESLGNVLSERTMSVDALPKQGGLRLLNLSLQDLEFSGARKGLFVVRVQDTERLWLRQDKLVAVTDIGLIVKQSARGTTTVFANSIRTAQPLSGVAVQFVSTNNQVMGSVTTNAAGVAEFDSTAATSRFRLGMITGVREADFTFLDLKGSRVETSRFEVGGLTNNAAHYQAFIYGDGDLYRPGDTVQTNTIVRRADDWQTPPAGLPLKIRLLLPTGQEYSNLRQQLTPAGSFAARFILPPTVMTGAYTLEVLTGNDVLLAARKISVEEFIPDRLKVTVTAAPATVRPGQEVTARISALNLFGPPAADRKFEVEFSLKPKVF